MCSDYNSQSLSHELKAVVFFPSLSHDKSKTHEEVCYKGVCAAHNCLINKKPIAWQVHQKVLFSASA